MVAVDGKLETHKFPVAKRSLAMAEHQAMESMRQQSHDIDRYLYLRELQSKNEALFYQVLLNNAQELMPYVYTPTVGEACQRRSELPIETRGIYLTPADKGKILQKLQEWPEKNVRVIVVTDGERILGLGDLGWGGMGISEGKILLYTVIAGVNPKMCLPVCLDVGTNNQTLLDDPDYKGLRQPRIKGPELDEIVEEFMGALRQWQPHVLLQFEDFGNTNAFRLLDTYREKQCCFNDDIQGTAGITLAGILSALRVTKRPLSEQRILFLGAGEAGTGIGHLIAMALQKGCGFTPEEALRSCFFLDSKGLVCKSRTNLQHHKLAFAHDVPFQPDLLSAVKELRPTVLIGVSTIPGAFSKEVIEAMAEINERPIIFPLSNPTSKSECTYADAFNWTGGRVVFASGSPFPRLKAKDGKLYYPAQANNAYVFPCIGMAAILTQCKSITDEVFLAAAESLAALVPEDELEAGRLFPSFTDFRDKDLGVVLSARVAEYMVSVGLGAAPSGVAGWAKYVKSHSFQPEVAKVQPVKVVPLPSPRGMSPAHAPEDKEILMMRDMYTDLQKYLFLRHLQDEDQKAFWRVLINNAQEVLPYVYTPTVGEACQKYSRLPIKTRGVFIRASDKGRILDVLKTWPKEDIRVIVVTDGECILGLGDLGYGGMGISEGKILLYTVIAGVNPDLCLPVCLDVGTNTQSLLDDPEYKGVRQPRIKGPELDEIVEEFMGALRQWQPHVLLQFEDFGNTNAFRLLDTYRDKQCCFNDDIQGTACITLAGILSALRVTKRPLSEQCVLFLGAGEAGTGIGHLIAMALEKRCGFTPEQALRSCFFLDSKGLVCKSRTNLQHHKLPFAHDVPFQPDLLSAVKELRPTVLIGVSTIPGAFSKEVVEAMTEINERPVIFPLSNPTSKSECTFKDAFEWSGERVVFASGSPYTKLVAHDHVTYYPAQANNAYVFPAIGMAAILTHCRSITDEVFLTVAEELAALVPEKRLAVGGLFPAFSEMKAVAPKLIARTATFMVKTGLGTTPAGVDDWEAYASEQMFRP